MHQWRVHNIMRTKVAGVHEHAPLSDIIDALAGRAEIVPVVDAGNRVVGVVCAEDLRGWVPTLDAEGGASNRQARIDVQVPVRELMSVPAWTVDAQASLSEAARRMHLRRVWRLPVTGDGGRLVGVVTATDLLRVYGRLDSEIREDIVEVLHRTMYVDPQRVHVAVNNGEVTLAGTVERRSGAAAAAQLAYIVPGVVYVIDRLNYEYDDTPFPEDALPAGDSWSAPPSWDWPPPWSHSPSPNGEAVRPPARAGSAW